MRRNLILGGVLIVLIALAYIYQGPLRGWQNKLGKPGNLFAGLDTSKVNKMDVVKEGQTQTFEKNNGRWVVSGTKNFPAKNEIINGFLDAINTAKNLDMTVASTNKGKKAEYKTDASGIGFKLYDGTALLADFVAGKNSPDFSSTYISQGDSNYTYQAGANLRKYADQPDWKDDIIFSASKSKINKIRFQYPGNSFVVEKKNNQWAGISPYAFAVSQDKVDGIAGIMSNLTAAEIPEQTFKGTGLEKHTIIVEATGAGVDNTIMIGDGNGSSQYYAKRGDSDNIYLIKAADRDSLQKTIYQLK